MRGYPQHVARISSTGREDILNRSRGYPQKFRHKSCHFNIGFGGLLQIVRGKIEESGIILEENALITSHHDV